MEVLGVVSAAPAELWAWFRAHDLDTIGATRGGRFCPHLLEERDDRARSTVYRVPAMHPLAPSLDDVTTTVTLEQVGPSATRLRFVSRIEVDEVFRRMLESLLRDTYQGTLSRLEQHFLLRPDDAGRGAVASSFPGRSPRPEAWGDDETVPDEADVWGVDEDGARPK